MGQNKIKKKKKSFQINLFPACCVPESCVSFSSLILSPAIFGAFLNCNEIDTVRSAAFGKSPWSSYGHSHVLRSSLVSVCASVYFLLWCTPPSPPTLNIWSYLFPLQSRDPNPCSTRTCLTLQKLAICSQFFSGSLSSHLTLYKLSHTDVQVHSA